VVALPAGQRRGILAFVSATVQLPSTLPVVAATRYVLALREGGSLPAVVEADDLGTYVVKFVGAGQGPRALVAEIVVGSLARALGLPVPELVLIEIDKRLADAEPDEEVQDLLRASAGLNLGIDFLPGALDLAPSVDAVSPDLAARIVWFDAFTDNVDRTWRNPNLLLWHEQPWLIDHGAALYWQHDPARAQAATDRPLVGASEHVLLARAGALRDADAALAPMIDGSLLNATLELVPDAWLLPRPDLPDAPTPHAARGWYVDHLMGRLRERERWLTALEVARGASL
jgi:hypothetical protein